MLPVPEIYYLSIYLVNDTAGGDVTRGQPGKSSRGRRGNKRSQTVDIPVQLSLSNTCK